MERLPFGGGQNKMISLPKLPDPVAARMGLDGSPVGVIKQGMFNGMVVRPFWGAVRVEGMVPVLKYRIASDLYIALRQMDQMLSTYNEKGVLGEKESIYHALDTAWQLHDILLGLRNSTLASLAPRVRKLPRRSLTLSDRRRMIR